MNFCVRSKKKGESVFVGIGFRCCAGIAGDGKVFDFFRFIAFFMAIISKSKLIVSTLLGIVINQEFTKIALFYPENTNSIFGFFAKFKQLRFLPLLTIQKTEFFYKKG